MNLHRIPITLFAAAADAPEFPVFLGRKVELHGVILSDYDGIAAHAANATKIQVLASDESTTAWEWDTLSAGDGALTAKQSYGYAPGFTADTAKALESGIDLSEVTYDAGQPILIRSTSEGTGAARSACLVLIVKNA